MNLWDILILALVAAAVLLAFSAVGRGKSGSCHACQGGCAACGRDCDRRQKDKRV